MAMRTTTHHGRGRKGNAYGSKHNDRNFDVENATNIDVELLANNKYWCIYEGETFETAELKFYEENFSEQLQATNDKYVANRHPERCKTMEQWKTIKQNAPEESIFQVGKKSDNGQHIDGKTLMACYNEFIDFQAQWNKEHGSPFTVLNMALHVDEPNCPPHIHSRKVWHYKDENGILRVGQEKALELAGIELPNPDKAPGRYNNRKITYDKMMREKWLDILESHGLQVEREPLPDGKGKKSMEKEEFIRKKYEKMQAEAEALKHENDVLKQENERIRSEVRTSIKTKEEYDNAVLSITNNRNGFLHLILDVFEELREAYNSPDDNVWHVAAERFKNVVVAFENKILNLLGYEVKENLPEEERQSGTLQKSIDDILQQAQELSKNSGREPIDFNLEL